MIALRRMMERGVRHPVLGPFCLILLAFLVAFTVVHGTHDQMHESGELIVCIAIILTAIVSLVVPRLHVVRLFAPHASRAPPVVLLRPIVSKRRLFREVPVPLRL